MNRVIGYYREKICRELTDTQGALLILYLCFVHCFCARNGISPAERAQLGSGQLMNLFHTVPGYEIKLAVSNLELAIPWGLLDEHPELKEYLDQLQAALDREPADKAWLDDCLCTALASGMGKQGAILTPKSVCELLGRLAEDCHVEHIVDLGCGTFYLGLLVWEALGARREISCYGEEQLAQMCDVARLMLYFHGVADWRVENRDILSAPPTEKMRPNTLILADLPVGSNRAVNILPSDERNKGERGRVYTDWLFIQDALYRMGLGDRAFLLVTKGALVRRNEEKYRRRMLASDWLEAVITLPPNLYSNTSLARELMICNKNKAKDRKGKVLFGDLSGFSVRDSRRSCALTEDGILEMAEAYYAFESTAEFCTVADQQQIEQSGFSFNPLVYLNAGEQGKDALTLERVAEITRGLQWNQPAELARGEGACRILNVRDIKDGLIHYETAAWLPERRDAWDKKYLIQEDDIILTTRGTSLKIAVVPPGAPNAYISGNLTLIRIKKGAYHPYVLYEFLRSESGRQAMERIQTGTTIRVLNGASLGKLTIPRSDPAVIEAIGVQLKKEWLSYRERTARIEKEYGEKRQTLLSLLEMEKKRYESNFLEP